MDEQVDLFPFFEWQAGFCELVAFWDGGFGEDSHFAFPAQGSSGKGFARHCGFGWIQNGMGVDNWNLRSFDLVDRKVREWGYWSAVLGDSHCLHKTLERANYFL